MKRRTVLKLVGGGLASWCLAPSVLWSMEKEDAGWTVLDFIPDVNSQKPEWRGDDVHVPIVGFGKEGVAAIGHLHGLFGTSLSADEGVFLPPGVLPRVRPGNEGCPEDLYRLLSRADLVVLLGPEEMKKDKKFNKCIRVAREGGALTVAIAQKDHLATQVRQFSPLAHPVDFLAVLPPAPGDLHPGTALAEAAYFIPEMVLRQGLIGIDLADVRSTLQEAGDGHLAIGYGKGAERGGKAAAAALDLLAEQGLEADRISSALAIVHGSATDLSLDDFDLASSILNERLKPDANLLIALHTHPALHDQVRVSIAAGAKKTSGHRTAG